MKIHLGGQLVWYNPQKTANLEIHLEGPTRLAEVLAWLKIPAGEVTLVVVNGKLEEMAEACVKDEDRVELYPPIGGGGF